MTKSACEYVLKRIEDGYLFERFAQDLLAAIIGATFVPLGGTKDKGIDGLRYVYQDEERKTTVYQVSIQKQYESKIRETISKLSENGISFDRLFYVTNQECRDHPRITTSLFDSFNKHVEVWDNHWICSQVNSNERAERVYKKFVDAYSHEQKLPGIANSRLNFEPVTDDVS